MAKKAEDQATVASTATASDPAASASSDLTKPAGADAPASGDHGVAIGDSAQIPVDPEPKIGAGTPRIADADVSSLAIDMSAPADPAPATELVEPSGAIIEPEIARAVDLSHESVDDNPRAGTTSVQNAVDWNDAKRASPQDDTFAGQGLDQSVYGTPRAD